MKMMTCMCLIILRALHISAAKSQMKYVYQTYHCKYKIDEVCHGAPVFEVKEDNHGG
jgi:hypothetical protein